MCKNFFSEKKKILLVPMSLQRSAGSLTRGWLLAGLLGLAVFTNADILANRMTQLNDAKARNDTNLWQRLRDGFQLNHIETKEVKYWEKRYSNPKYFNIIMQNAAPYLYFVVTETERRGMPSELALIPIVESTYNPGAVSPAAISTGMWQFVSSSGKRFGLTQNSSLDERKDIIKSTRAAIGYLQYLHDLFGSWELAIAAYNWGEGNINNAVVNAGSKNFYDLNVRDVTRQYVPKVVALANIIRNPSKFGIKLTDLNNTPYFAVIKPNAPMPLNNFIAMANLSPTTFKKLNPQFSSDNYIADSNQRLLLPLANQPIYMASLNPSKDNLPATIPINNNLVQTAANINDNQQTTTTSKADNDAIAVNNDNINNDGINQLVAEAASKPAPSVSAKDLLNDTDIKDANTEQATAKISHEKKEIAIDFNSQSNATLAYENTETLSASKTKSSIRLVPNLSEGQNFINYIVAPGDTLYSIAKKFNLPIDTIKADNQLVDNTVKLKQKLLIRAATSST